MSEQNEPVLVGDLTSTGCDRDQYWSPIRSSTGHFVDQYWLPYLLLLGQFSSYPKALRTHTSEVVRPSTLPMSIPPPIGGRNSLN